MQSVEEKYRSEYYKVVDSACVNMVAYFTSTDIAEQNRLSSMLLDGEYHQDLVFKYPELSNALQLNLSFFRSQYEASSVEEYRKIFQGMKSSCKTSVSRS